MFSARQKREISEKIQIILKETGHPELPKNEINFLIHVEGEEIWSWADIQNNGAVKKISVDSWNKKKDVRN